MLRHVRAMSQRPLDPLSIYVAIVVLAGAVLLSLDVAHVTFPDPVLFGAMLTASVVVAVSRVQLPLAGGGATLSMAYFTDFMALVVLGAPQAMLIVVASGLTQCAFNRRGETTARQAIFSAAALVITMQAAGAAAGMVGGFSLHAPLGALARPAVAAAAVFFCCNSFLIAAAVALSKRQPVFRTWYDSFAWVAPACFVGAGAAVLAVRMVVAFQWWIVVLAVAPLYMTYRSYRVYVGRLEDQQRHLREMSDLHLATVEALARAIDARDQTIERGFGSGDNHIRRVQANAAALARAAGLSDDEVEGVKVAALLHDIGKLAVPEHILTKPGRLTPDEFDRVRVHPTVGAEIIKAVPFKYAVAPYIRSHHERWDGTGYPDGLAGEAIPLGARVLAVVDYFDALTAERPYHRAVAPAEAVKVLQSEIGRALDPRLVSLFVELLPSLAARDDEERAGVSDDHADHRAGAPVTGYSAESQSAPQPNVFQNISRATQEVHALYDIAQTLGTRLGVDDTMALLSSKLNRLIPASCWTLHLLEPGGARLRCRYASGLAADEIDGMAVPLGEGATGWAAQHATPLVNARATADFDAAGLPHVGRELRSALAYPLVNAGELVGTITLYHVGEEPFRTDHRTLLDRVANLAASVIRNAWRDEQLREVSLTDSLTDLPNSRALFAHLLEGLEAPGTRRALIMMDLDGLKGLNDEHGHHVGDLALRQVAATIRHMVRQSDFCARYAGDEFVAVLPGCERGEAERRAAALQDAVGRLVVDTPGGTRVTLSLSVGVATAPEDAATSEGLLEAADRRMYEDKRRRSVHARDAARLRLVRSA
jgi:diguanylate cyclase (GGDEF)-like protein/putative nucleotidyltransferase with HDIG domain